MLEWEWSNNETINVSSLAAGTYYLQLGSHFAPFVITR
jgi:hypothetical protein